MSLNPVADFLDGLPKPVRKVKVKIIITDIEWLKKCYYAARERGFEHKYPAAAEQGYYFKKPFPDLQTSNGTTRYITECLNNLGHFSERINTTGIMRKGKWTHAANTTGSTDIHCSIIIPSQKFPVPWKIEVKRSKDGLRKAQEQYKEKTLSVGALHSTVYVGDLKLFWDEYKRIIAL